MSSHLAVAQSSITFATGGSIDLNNTQPFYHIPVSLQWKPFPGSQNPFMVEINYYIPFKRTGSGLAYSANPALPQQVNLKETISPYLLAISAGGSFYLFTTKQGNKFFLNLLLGYCNQNFKVMYLNYDKANYEVLNPDVNKNKCSFVFSFAGVYNFHLLQRDLQLKLNLQTPLLLSIGRYPLSYKFVAPLSLTFGYNLYYNKIK
ncbi:MAG: hypothetical protein ABI683_14490 [Ginsengibacter sp.]